MKRYKFPRTPHLPWSESSSSDDLFMAKPTFEGKFVVVTEKLDGENTTMYSDYIHARSLEATYHISRDWVRALHGSIKHSIMPGMRICGENMFAKHSIFYPDLITYFYVFSIWFEDECYSWEDTLEEVRGWGLALVPILYWGAYDEDAIKHSWTKTINGRESEGYVIRNAESFKYEDYSQNVGKFVRKNHVQTTDFWRTQAVVKNQLKKEVQNV